MFSFDPSSAEKRKVQRQEVIEYLRSAEPSALLQMAEDGALAAFERARTSVPAYQTILREAWGDRKPDITDIAAYRRHVPVLDKHQTFGRFAVRDLCVGGTLSGVRSVLTSSGHSGVFSFGVNTDENLGNSAHAIDLGLQYMFGVDDRRTLLINALPMGVKVHTSATTLAETSVRDDMVHAVIAAYGREFEQIILVGEGSFIKKIVEDGIARGIDWPSLPVRIIVGEEGIAENYRTYMAKLLGIACEDKTPRNLASSMGIAELDLNIFHETADTIAIRRLAHEDPRLRERLFGKGARFCPMFFVYYPHRCLVEQFETEQGPELMLSMLSAQMRIPLLRYRTGDLGRAFTYDEVVKAMRDCGHPIEPDLKLPFVATWGRDPEIRLEGGGLTAGAVKEAIYVHHDIAGTVTGNFLISRDGGRLRLDVQLKPGQAAAPQAQERFLSALARYSDAQPEVQWCAYRDFPTGMTLDYERKFSYVRREK